LGYQCYLPLSKDFGKESDIYIFRSLIFLKVNVTSNVLHAKTVCEGTSEFKVIGDFVEGLQHICKAQMCFHCKTL